MSAPPTAAPTAPPTGALPVPLPLPTVALLLASSAFMTFARYGNLKTFRP